MPRFFICFPEIETDLFSVAYPVDFREIHALVLLTESSWFAARHPALASVAGIRSDSRRKHQSG
jgi:hypothetical protein